MSTVTTSAFKLKLYQNILSFDQTTHTPRQLSILFWVIIMKITATAIAVWILEYENDQRSRCNCLHYSILNESTQTIIFALIFLLFCCCCRAHTHSHLWLAFVRIENLSHWPLIQSIPPGFGFNFISNCLHMRMWINAVATFELRASINESWSSMRSCSKSKSKSSA